VFFFLYVIDMPVTYRNVELAFYADDTAIIATSRKLVLFIRYLETYLNNVQRWLREWRIAINISKTNGMLFIKAPGEFPDLDRVLTRANPMG
jgi:hypothetical protein